MVIDVKLEKSKPAFLNNEAPSRVSINHSKTLHLIFKVPLVQILVENEL